MKTLEERMSALVKGPCQVRIHDNSSTYLRTVKKFGVLHFHMHKLFAEAPTPVLEAVLRFAKGKDKNALRMIRQMAELYFAENKAEPVPLPTKGKIYDLQQLLEKVRAEYFAPDYAPAIGWSNRRPKKRSCSITFGSYDRRRHQIRINPILDSAEVPSYFVEFVVYHEMLHGICLPVERSGRTSVHTPEFRAKERNFAHFAQVKLWEKKRYGRT